MWPCKGHKAVQMAALQPTVVKHSWQDHNHIGIFTILFQMRRSRWLQMLRNSLKKQGNWYVVTFHSLTTNCWGK